MNMPNRNRCHAVRHVRCRLVALCLGVIATVAANPSAYSANVSIYLDGASTNVPPNGTAVTPFTSIGSASASARISEGQGNAVTLYVAPSSYDARATTVGRWDYPLALRRWPAKEGPVVLGDENLSQGIPQLVGDTTAAWGDAGANPPIPNVLNSFVKLANERNLLGFYISPETANNLGVYHHWQGIQRSTASDGKYLFLSRNQFGDDADRSELVMVHMASAPSVPTGTALGPNRTDQSDAPPTSDMEVAYRTFTSHKHAGGIQLAGHLLAIPLEDPDAHIPRTVLFFNMSNPTNPVAVPTTFHQPAYAAASEHAGTASMTKLANGTYLLIIGGNGAEDLDFYVTTQTHPANTTPSSLEFNWFYRWYESEFIGNPSFEWNEGWGGESGGGNGKGLQNICILTQADGTLFLLGNFSTEVPNLGGSHYLHLAKLENGTAPHFVRISAVGEMKMDTDVGSLQANLRAAGGAYVDPNGKLLFYATEHEHDGPDGTVKGLEWVEFP